MALPYTGNLALAAKIGLTAAVAKTTSYDRWERVWNRISWGRAPAESNPTPLTTNGQPTTSKTHHEFTDND